jgi:hypothetical protein
MENLLTLFIGREIFFSAAREIKFILIMNQNSEERAFDLQDEQSASIDLLVTSFYYENKNLN